MIEFEPPLIRYDVNKFWGDPTLDDLMMCRPGGIIRTRAPQSVQFDGKRALVAV